MPTISPEEKKNLSQMRIILLCAFPVATVWTMSWFGVFTFVNAYVIKGLHFSNKDWATVTLWFAGGMVFWQILCTEISSRLGRRSTIFLAMLTSALFFIFAGHVENLTFLGILLFFLGFTPAVFSAVWLPMVAETGGYRPGRALGTAQWILNGMTVLTLMTGGRFVSNGNFRGVFMICGAVCCFCGLFFYMLTSFLREAERGHIVSLLRIRKEDVVGLVRGPLLWVLLLGSCVEPFNYHTANQLFPNLARDIHGVSEQMISFIVALGRLPALLSLFIIANFVDRSSPSRCYGIGIIWAASGIVFMGLAANILQVIAGYVMFYLGHGIVWGTNTVSVNACVETRFRDSSFAIMSIFMTVSAFAVGAFHRWMLGNGLPLSSVFVICGIVAAVGGISLIIKSLRKL